MSAVIATASGMAAMIACQCASIIPGISTRPWQSTTAASATVSPAGTSDSMRLPETSTPDPSRSLAERPSKIRALASSVRAGAAACAHAVRAEPSHAAASPAPSPRSAVRRVAAPPASAMRSATVCKADSGMTSFSPAGFARPDSRRHWGKAGESRGRLRETGEGMPGTTAQPRDRRQPPRSSRSTLMLACRSVGRMTGMTGAPATSLTHRASPSRNQDVSFA